MQRWRAACPRCGPAPDRCRRRGGEQAYQARLGIDQLAHHRIERLLAARGAAGARQHAPRLADRVDAAFLAGGRWARPPWRSRTGWPAGPPRRAGRSTPRRGPARRHGSRWRAGAAPGSSGTRSPSRRRAAGRQSRLLGDQHLLDIAAAQRETLVRPVDDAARRGRPVAQPIEQLAGERVGRGQRHLFVEEYQTPRLVISIRWKLSSSHSAAGVSVPPGPSRRPAPIGGRR